MLMFQLRSLLTCVYTPWPSRPPPKKKHGSAFARLRPFKFFSHAHLGLRLRPGTPERDQVGENLTRFPVSAELLPPAPSSPPEQPFGRHSQTAEGLAHSQTASKHSHPPHGAPAEHPQPDQHHHHHHHQLEPRGSHGGGKAYHVALGGSSGKWDKKRLPDERLVFWKVVFFRALDCILARRLFLERGVFQPMSATAGLGYTRHRGRILFNTVSHVRDAN